MTAMEACQLLCASSATYDIVEAGTLPLTSPYVKKAGFTKPPVAFVGGDGVPKINACLVGTAGNAVVVAFRGTLTSYTGNLADDWSTFLDWIQNFLAEPVRIAGLPGKIHGGFQKTFFSLWPQAAVEVQKQIAALGGAAKFFATGHSKGGPLARYASWVLSQPPFNLNPTCATFAAPRAGDQEFVNAYERNLRISDTRYEYRDDLVPQMPPSSTLIATLKAIPGLPERLRSILKWAGHWNFASVGTLAFINWDNQIARPTSWWHKTKLNVKRIGSLARLLARGHVHQIREDHRLSGGYCANLCPPETCSAQLKS